MPEAGPPAGQTPNKARRGRPDTQRSGVFRDPVVRVMSYAALGLVIAFLVTVVSALLTGVLAPSGPRTALERETAVSGTAVREGSTDAAVWGRYIAALTATGQYSRARGLIGEARASLDDSATAEFTLAEARLYAAQKQHDRAIEAADAAMKQISEHHEKEIAAGGSRARSAELKGLPENYWSAVLVKAYAYRDLGEWDNAVEQFDIFLDQTPTAADILIDRGLTKIEAGDDTGAEVDLRAAMQFLPDDPDALEGLASIGVTP